MYLLGLGLTLFIIVNIYICIFIYRMHGLGGGVYTFKKPNCFLHNKIITQALGLHFDTNL